MSKLGKKLIRAAQEGVEIVRGVQIEAGKSYLNGRDDLIGPMRLIDGVFLDQYGRLYHANGIQWDHVPGSTGNITKPVNGL